MPVLVAVQHRLHGGRTVFLHHLPDTVRPAKTDPRGRTGPGAQGRAPAVEMLDESRGRTSGPPGHTSVRCCGHPASEVRSPGGDGDVFARQPRVPTATAAEHDRRRVSHLILHVRGNVPFDPHHFGQTHDDHVWKNSPVLGLFGNKSRPVVVPALMRILHHENGEI